MSEIDFWYQDGLLHPTNTAAVFYNDLPPEDAAHWDSLLLPKSADKTSIDVAPVCYDVDVPITVLLCTDDPMFEMLQGMAMKLKRPRWRIEKIAGGHSPFLGRKQELIEVIRACLAV